MVLVGMPGIEKRIARFLSSTPELASFPNSAHSISVEMQKLLEQRWTPVGVRLPNEQLPPEVIAKLISRAKQLVIGQG